MPDDKHFELSFPYHEFALPNGYRTYPILQVGFVSPGGGITQLPMLVDTGSDVTVLRREYHYLLGLEDWNIGRRVNAGHLGSEEPALMYEYDGVQLEVCGRRVSCTVALAVLGNEGFYQGLLGRDGVFQQFGFGFWESSSTIFVTPNP